MIRARLNHTVLAKVCGWQHRATSYNDGASLHDHRYMTLPFINHGSATDLNKRLLVYHKDTNKPLYHGVQVKAMQDSPMRRH